MYECWHCLDTNEKYSLKDLKNHLIKEHETYELYRCRFCKFIDEGKAEMDDHLLTNHGDELYERMSNDYIIEWIKRNEEDYFEVVI